MGDRSLASKTVTNIVWSYASFFSAKVINTTTVVFLSWLLSPHQFGLMALALAFMAYFELLAQFGLGSALISARYDEETSGAAVAVFAGMIILSAVIMGATALSAGYIAGSYGEPLLEPMLLCLSLVLPIRCIGVVNNSYLSRELKFRTKLVPDLAGSLARAGLSVALVLSDFGVWALVWGHLAGAAVSTISLLVIRPWWPRQWPDIRTTWQMVKYGANLVGAQAINMTPRLLDSLLIGKLLGPAALGVYMMGSRMPDLIIRNSQMVTAPVLHPLMSSMQMNLPDLRIYYYNCLRYSSIYVFGAAAALFVLSQPIADLLFHEKWSGIIRPMQLLAIAYAISSLSALPGVVYKAINRTDILLKVAVINLPVIIVGLWVAVPHGIEAVALAKIALAAVRMVPNQIFLRRTIGIRFAESAFSIVPGLVCSGALLIAGLGVQRIEFGSELASLLGGSLVCGAAYLIAVRLVSPELYYAASSKLLRKFRSA